MHTLVKIWKLNLLVRKRKIKPAVIRCFFCLLITRSGSVCPPARPALPDQAGYAWIGSRYVWIRNRRRPHLTSTATQEPRAPVSPPSPHLSFLAHTSWPVPVHTLLPYHTRTTSRRSRSTAPHRSAQRQARQVVLPGFPFASSPCLRLHVDHDLFPAALSPPPSTTHAPTRTRLLNSTQPNPSLAATPPASHPLPPRPHL